ncbi:MAG: hypothetical protein EZS28_039133, partial [Streblomastix strix]
LGLAETCNVGYYAAIVADGQTVVQISGSTIRTFEGPAVRALNGASVTIDKNTILDNNGLRNRNTLSSFQTNVVCEGGIGISTVHIALDNVTSFASTGNGWIFSSQENSCIVRATFNDQPALPRSFPYINSANVAIRNSNKAAEVTTNGKFLEPCFRTLVLELHEKNKDDKRVTYEFDIDSQQPNIEYLDSQNIIFQFPYTLLENLDYTVEWEIGIYESGKREFASWASTQPTEIRIIGPDIDIKLILSIVMPIVVFIIARQQIKRFVSQKE